MRYLSFTLLALLSTCAAPAMAQVRCTPDYEGAVRARVEKHGEEKIGTGVGVSGTTITEFWMNPAKNTYTILVIHAQGPVCFVAAGKEWVWNEEPQT